MGGSSPSTAGSERRVLRSALLISLGLHAALVLGLSGVAFLRIEPPIPIEVLPLKKRPPAPPVVEPAPEKPPPPKPVKKRAGPGTPKPPSKPVTPPAPPPDDLRAIGPAGANITIVLRGTLLRTSPHKEGVDQLLSVLPDYHTLLDGTDLDPFVDLDALLIATPDPRDVAATFLAARHHGDPRVEHLAERTLSAGDPRRFQPLGSDLMLLGRPDDLARITRVEALEEPPDAGELGEAARWLGALRGFDTSTESNKDAAFQLTIADLPLLVRIPGGALPLPRTLRLAMSAEPSPRLRMLCVFDEPAQAIQFVATWPEVRRQLPIGFSGALDDIKLTRHEREVELDGRLPEAQVRMALSLAQMFGPPRRALPRAPVGAPAPSEPN